MTTQANNIWKTVPDALTLEAAKGLQQGMYLNAYDALGNLIMYADGKRPARYKVTSVKTWKRTPERVEVRLQYGLKLFFHITQEHLAYWRIQP